MKPITRTCAMKMPHLTVSEIRTMLDGKPSEAHTTGQEETMKTMNDRWDGMESYSSLEKPKVDPADYPALILGAGVEDVVNRPDHYTSHPSGVECIQITEHMGFNTGNALKYIWRADLKGKPVQDLEKAMWYIKREIALRSMNDD